MKKKMRRVTDRNNRLEYRDMVGFRLFDLRSGLRNDGEGLTVATSSFTANLAVDQVEYTAQWMLRWAKRERERATKQ